MTMVKKAAGTRSVDLSIPVQSNLVVLARLAAATVASRAGFGVEDIEDLRLAVEELCLSLVGARDDGRLHLSYEWEGDTITVGCWYEAGEAKSSPPKDDAGELSLRILDALVDDHGHDLRDGRPGAWLRMCRPAAPA